MLCYEEVSIRQANPVWQIQWTQLQMKINWTPVIGHLLDNMDKFCYSGAMLDADRGCHMDGSNSKDQKDNRKCSVSICLHQTGTTMSTIRWIRSVQ